MTFCHIKQAIPISKGLHFKCFKILFRLVFMCDLQLNTLKDPALTYNKMIFRLPLKCYAIKPVNIYSLQ